MSAAPIPHTVSKEGWPSPGPDNGFCRVPHYVLERIWRVCATPVEVGCVCLILDQTVGYGRASCKLAVGWMADRLGVTERAVLMSLDGACERGYVTRQRAGKLNEYAIDLDALRTAPDFEHPKPQLVTSNAGPDVRPPRTRNVKTSRVILKGRTLKTYTDKELLVADQGAATVAVCGECKTVGVFEMVPEGELSFQDDGEEKAKPEVQFRSAAPARKAAPVEKPRKVQPIAVHAGPSDERVKAVHRYLCTWREAFHDTPPTIGQTRAVAAELGDAPIEYLDGVMKQRRRWLFERAEHYGAVKALARQARESFEQEEGLPCPCGRTRLKAGQICSHCGPAPKANAPAARRGPQEPWDQVKAALQLTLEPAAYTNWVESTYLVNAHDHHLHVAVPDEATVQFLEQEYASQITTALAETAGPGYQVEYAIEASHG